MVLSQEEEGSAEKKTKEYIDWEKQIAYASGIGAPNPDLPVAAQRPAAIRAAKADALRNMMEMLKGVNITSDTDVEDMMLKSDKIKTSLKAQVTNGFRMVGKPRYMSDGTVEVSVEMPLLSNEKTGRGGIYSLLLPENTGESKLPFGKTSGTTEGEGAYTGLIVDARGLGIQPAMAPKILDEQGNEVYGTGYVDREYAVKVGVVGYAKEIKKASADKRVADNPLIIKGIKASGTAKTDIVISDGDAKKILGLASNLSFLEKCKVMIILD